ncbi:MAG: aminopeptidase P N-terminal domain-containing protein [Betaproteobacteria bacterium]|nr:aminopeptidase P N-terminal domain-containing protein [Betaproteobacteria bacterium]
MSAVAELSPATAPELPDAQLVERCAARRAQLARRIADAGGGVAVLPTAPERMRNRDADYPYRHDSYVYYLSGFSEPQSLLVLEVEPDGSSRSTLLCRPRDAEREIWDGVRFGPEAACEAFGLDAAACIDQADQLLPRMLLDRASVWWPFGVHESFGSRVQAWLQAGRAQARAGHSVPSAQQDLCAVLDELRLFKDDYELQVLRRAAAISAQAHRRAMRAAGAAARADQREYHHEAELLHASREGGSQAPAYGSIVAAGANACILHYRAGNATLRRGSLCLIDAGCELDGYASDITRTFPVGGRFSPAQRELYDIVLHAQHAAIEAVRPGARFTDPHEAALRVLAQGLLDTGLIPRKVAPDVDAVLESGAYRRFYMHRTSHWMGMDVHDCGEYAEPGEPPRVLSDGARQPASRILRPGMVLTIEPGLYVRAADDLPEAYHDIGIRIEDDVVVRAHGECEVLTAKAPKTVAEIEQVMHG